MSLDEGGAEMKVIAVFVIGVPAVTVLSRVIIGLMFCWPEISCGMTSDTYRNATTAFILLGFPFGLVLAWIACLVED